MAVPTPVRFGDVYDAAPDYVYTVSLLAALECATGQEGHATLLPYLGMARAELTDFGQRRPARFDAVHVVDLRVGLADLDDRLSQLLADSDAVQDTLRIDAARQLVRCGAASALLNQTDTANCPQL